LAIRGTATPSNPPAHPPSGNPLMYLFVGAAPKKWSHFETTFLKQKQVLGALIRYFSPFETTKRRAGEIGVKRAVYRVMG
jgi:hypothetical protein